MMSRSGLLVMGTALATVLSIGQPARGEEDPTVRLYNTYCTQCHGLQRNGIGRALYTCLLDMLRLQGYRTAAAIICVPNENSEALHTYFGFTKSGVVTNAGYKKGAWRSAAWYALALSDYPGEPTPPLPIGEVIGTEEFGKIMERSTKP